MKITAVREDEQQSRASVQKEVAQLPLTVTDQKAKYGRSFSWGPFPSYLAAA